MDSILQSKVFNLIVIIAVVALMMSLISYSESKDLTCPNGPNTEDTSQCYDGNGKAYNSSKFVGDPEIEESLKAIKSGSQSVTGHVFWRRFMLGAIPTTLAIFIFVLARFPTIFEFFVTLFLIFACGYFTQNFYNYHFYKNPIDNINKHVKNISKKLKKERLSVKPECDVNAL